MTGKTYRSEQVSMTLEEAIHSAYSDLSSLGDEMREWADNLDAGNLGATEKYQNVSDTADALENITGEEPSEIIAELTALPLTWTEDRKRGKLAGQESRAVRCSNAVAALQAAIDALREKVEAIEELASTLEEAVDNAQGVDFPGMYG